jgi:hypothetical protein
MWPRGSDGSRVSAAHGPHALARSAPSDWTVRLLTTTVATLLMLSPAASRQLTAIRVGEGQDLQAAIDAAKPGDVILLASGAHFTGNFILRAHPSTASAFITIRTDAPGLPDSGTRTGPQFAPLLAELRSPTNEPALRAAPGAHHWRIENVAFAPNRRGDGNIIELGDARQTSLDRVPAHLVLDRVYVRGDPLWGQKRGIALNSASTEIRNSYVAGIRAIGADTQAIAGWNGPGPFVIDNNYLEAAGENILFGGADPAIPDLVPQHIAITNNDITRPAAWRQPVLAAPAAVTARGADGGMLTAGTYTYKVLAERPTSGGATALSGPATATVTVDDGGAVALSWDAVDDAAAYRVYRIADGNRDRGSVYWRVETTAYTDDGRDGRSGAVPKDPSVWSVKNLLELKNAADVDIAGNRFSYHWAGGQPGYAIVFTPRNQDGKAPWSRVSDVRFRNNVVQHVGAGINILGVDNNHPSGRATGITIAANVFTDVDHAAWGGNGDFVQIGDGAADIHVEDNTVDQTGRILSLYGRPSTGVVFRGNIVRHNAYGVRGDATASGLDSFRKFTPDAVFAGNIIAGGDASKYPKGNRFVSAAEFARLIAARTTAPAGSDPHPPGTR